jgi:hypothetical protein
MNSEDFGIQNSPWQNGRLTVSPNGRFLQHENGTPFFWLGDTAWLLFMRTSIDEAATYLEDRRSKGFNVIQAMVVHSQNESNAYGKSPFENNDFSRPLTNENNGYWEYIDQVFDIAEKKGMYLAIVPVWGSMVRSNALSVENAAVYGEFLARRYAHRPNVIWIIGGDTHGCDQTDVWDTLATSIRRNDPTHPMTFHPFGRTRSSEWFHDRPWLDFNMFQSGHRRYHQIMDCLNPDGVEGSIPEEDNWRYVQADYALNPPKPTVDGEPSYEDIPQGLHDIRQPRWQAEDVRRYAYWSVFAGAFGHTYGNNSVIQMLRSQDRPGNYGASRCWQESINDPGASQMCYLKALILAVPYFDRAPAQEEIAGAKGLQYDYLAATKGRDYLLVYTYTGRAIPVKLGTIEGDAVRAFWYSPLNGSFTPIGIFPNAGVCTFVPPGEEHAGNDWVLAICNAQRSYFPF